jgi:hypothetical protein
MPKEWIKTKKHNISAGLIFAVLLYVSCYVGVLWMSGLYIAQDGIDFTGDITRFILGGLPIIAFVLCAQSTFIIDSDVYDTIGSPLTLHSLSVVTFIVSILASVFSSAILGFMQSWAERFDHTLPREKQKLLVSADSMAVFLIAGVMMILILFICHGRQAHRIKKTLESEQKQQSKDLRDAIRVAPPPYFTKMLADVTDQSEDFLSQIGLDYAGFLAFHNDDTNDAESKIVRAEQSIAKQRIALRAVLTAFGRLARTYDNVNPADPSSDIEYRANLMLSLEVGGLSLDAVFPEQKPPVRFEVPFDAKPSYFLAVDQRLSIKIGTRNKSLFKALNGKDGDFSEIEPNDFTQDRDVKDALLPVYWKDNDKTLINYNMIGAPTAIVKGENVFIPDTHFSIENAKNYPEDIQVLAKDYFYGDKKGRSIVSMPVATRHFKCDPNELPKPSIYFGTINLYRNEENIFSGHNDNFRFFCDFTRPLSLIMGRMSETHLGTLILLQKNKLNIKKVVPTV